MRRTADDDETIRKRSGWVIPLTVIIVTLGLSAAFLVLYLAPPGPGMFGKQISPTSRSDVIPLSVSGHSFRIPANYLPYAEARQGGALKEIELFALLPGLTGWSNWDAEAFNSNAADSKVIYLILHQDRVGLSEAGKLSRVYLDYLQERQGQPAPYGLRHYRFREDTGYRNEDLFVGTSEKGPVIMRCVQVSHEVPSPSCLREILITRGVALSYRFKREHLSQWHEIAAKVDKLMASFSSKP